METYLLIVLVFIFIGLMGVVALLDRRSRTEMAHFDQMRQSLQSCLEVMQAARSGSETQMAQVAEALSSLRAVVEAGTKKSAETASGVSAETTRAVSEAATRLEKALGQQQEAQNAAGHAMATKLSGVVQASSRELLAEAERTTKALQALKASLEESVKF